MIYRFGDVRIDTAARQATRDDATAHLTRKAFDLLVLLIEQRPNVVAKESIHARLWPDTFVSESSVQALISEIRQAFADGSRSIIRTVHGVGYAFGPDVTEVAAEVPGRRARAWLLADTWRVALYDGDNVLGRGSDDVIPIDVPGISRRHACIAVGERATIEDLGSKNGTWLHDQRVTASTPLTDGDQVRLGSVLFTFRRARGVATTDTQAVGRTGRSTA
jgi:DNA-binding winged helix-turn-helix (wHTH) protein